MYGCQLKAVQMHGIAKPRWRPRSASWMAFAVSQRWPAVVQPLALDVSDLLLAYSETGRDVLPGLNHAHVMVLGVHQGQEHFLALVLGQGSVDHAGMPSSGRGLAGAVAENAGIVKRNVPPQPLQRRPVTEEAHGGIAKMVQLGVAVSTKTRLTCLTVPDQTQLRYHTCSWSEPPISPTILGISVISSAGRT